MKPTNEKHDYGDSVYQEEWLSAYLDDELTVEQREIVEERLATDSAAQATMEDLERLRGLVQQLPPWNGPRIELSQELIARAEALPDDEVLSAESSGNRKSVSEQERARALGNTEFQSRTSLERMPSKATVRRLRWLRPLSLAAGVLLVFGIGYALWREGGPAQRPFAASDTFYEAAPDLDRQVAESVEAGKSVEAIVAEFNSESATGAVSARAKMVPNHVGPSDLIGTIETLNSPAVLAEKDSSSNMKEADSKWDGFEPASQNARAERGGLIESFEGASSAALGAQTPDELLNREPPMTALADMSDLPAVEMALPPSPAAAQVVGGESGDGEKARDGDVADRLGDEDSPAPASGRAGGAAEDVSEAQSDEQPKLWIANSASWSTAEISQEFERNSALQNLKASAANSGFRWLLVPPQNVNQAGMEDGTRPASVAVVQLAATQDVEAILSRLVNDYELQLLGAADGVKEAGRAGDWGEASSFELRSGAGLEGPDEGPGNSLGAVDASRQTLGRAIASAPRQSLLVFGLRGQIDRMIPQLALDTDPPTKPRFLWILPRETASGQRAADERAVLLLNSGY